MAGCPVRWHDGPDRPCIEHANETIRAAAELGIDWMTAPPPGDGAHYHPSHAEDGSTAFLEGDHATGHLQ
jgi:hypothetical protein